VNALLWQPILHSLNPIARAISHQASWEQQSSATFPQRNPPKDQEDSKMHQIIKPDSEFLGCQSLIDGISQVYVVQDDNYRYPDPEADLHV
jgi:hypothetical protein